QYKQYLQIGLTSFMVFLAGCGPVSVPNHIDTVNTQSSTPILSSIEASCNNELVLQDVIEARQKDAQFMLNQGRPLEEVKQIMMSFCDGITN
ncbi:MAG TPA: hypothetical protein PLS49_02560, partial [Candidatus Woesebacteria bacterium]|nr:hypothetical protein [Candidatus Woesebacteria bacterium]